MAVRYCSLSMIRSNHIHKMFHFVLGELTLNKGNDHWIEPGRLHFDGHQKVVSVHESMHTIIHGHENDGIGRRIGKALPTVK